VIKLISIKIKIKEVRERENISLRELERRTGIERHYLAKLENKEADEILLSEIIFIAIALGKNLEDLFEVETIDIR
jgi:transcriptional regulator with XRE-family HTH domain